MVETTAHVICCSEQSGCLEENPYDVCRSLWLEMQDCLSMGEHDGQLISASQEKCHVMHFFFFNFCCWDKKVGGVICPVAFIQNVVALRSLSHDAGLSASVSQFRRSHRRYSCFMCTKYPRQSKSAIFQHCLKFRQEL